MEFENQQYWFGGIHSAPTQTPSPPLYGSSGAYLHMVIKQCGIDLVKEGQHQPSNCHWPDPLQVHFYFTEVLYPCLCILDYRRWENWGWCCFKNNSLLSDQLLPPLLQSLPSTIALKDVTNSTYIEASAVYNSSYKAATEVITYYKLCKDITTYCQW